MSDKSILFLSKEGDEHCKKALEFIGGNFSFVSVHFGGWGDSLPENVSYWHGDYIISYLSRWILPEWLLERAKIAAINFHPASPDYPGIGCNNFALYEGAKEYGVTCHHMVKKVDTGDIITVKRFPIFPTDDVGSLLRRTYEYQLVLFHEIMEGILKNESLPFSKERWTRKPFTRKELDKLSVITSTMTKEEIKRRVRATSYGNFQPTIKIGDYIFELKIWGRR